MNIIDGKAVSAAVKDEVKEQVAALKKTGVYPVSQWYWWETIPHPKCMSGTKNAPASIAV